MLNTEHYQDKVELHLVENKDKVSQPKPSVRVDEESVKHRLAVIAAITEMIRADLKYGFPRVMVAKVVRENLPTEVFDWLDADSGTELVKIAVEITEQHFKRTPLTA